MGAYLATRTVGAPISSLPHRQNVKNLKYSTHKGDVFFDDDLSAIKDNPNSFGNGAANEDADSLLHQEIMAHVKERFKDGNNFLKLHMFDRAKSKYLQAFEDLHKLGDITMSTSERGEKHENATGKTSRPLFSRLCGEDLQTEAQKRLALSNLGVLQFAEGRYEHARKLIEQATEMRDCYIRCLKNGDSENTTCVLPCSCSPPQDNKAVDAEPITETNKADKDNAKESVAATSSTSDAGKHVIISPREIEACIYYPELKSLLSEDLKHSGSLVSLSIELSKDITFHRIPDCKRILQAKISEHGSVDAIIADLLNNLAACHEVMGDVVSAMKFYEESLKLRQLVFGSRSLKAADLMQNLATVLDGQGRLLEARDLLDEALSIQEEHHPGEVSMETAVTLNNLGVVNAHIGDMKKARSYLQRTADARVRAYGKEHAFTQTADKNLEYIANKQRSCHHETDRPPMGGDGPAFAVVEV